MAQSQGPSSGKSRAAAPDQAPKGASSKPASESKDIKASSGNGMTKGGSQDQPAAPIQEQAGQLLKATREQATGQITSQKDRVASSLGILADALHQAGQQVRDKDDAAIAGYVDSAADQIEQLATTLREQNLTQLVETATRFGRQQPGLFLAATFALGFAGIRFMKSGSGQQKETSENGKTGSGANRGDASGRGDFWNEQPMDRDSSQYGGSVYGSGSGSSGFGMSEDYAMGSGSSQGMPSGSSKSARGADTMVGSEWAGSRDYDAGSEGL